MRQKKLWYWVGGILLAVILLIAVFLIFRLWKKEDSTPPANNKVEDMSRNEETEKDSTPDREKDIKETNDIVEVKRDKKSENTKESAADTEGEGDTQTKPTEDNAPDLPAEDVNPNPNNHGGTDILEGSVKQSMKNRAEKNGLK